MLECTEKVKWEAANFILKKYPSNINCIFQREVVK